MAGPVSELPAHQLARRQRIVEAALRLLETEEYERIQIRDVAAAADVALGTLYRYFSSKEHLYAAVLLLWTQRGAQRRRASPSESAEPRLRRRVHAVIRAFERNPQFYKVHQQLQSSADPNAAPLMSQFAHEAQQMVRAELQALDDDEADDIARMLWAIISTALGAAIYHDATMADAHRLIDRFVDLLAGRLAAGTDEATPSSAAG